MSAASTGGADVFADLTGAAAYRRLDAVRRQHVTRIDGSKWTSPGGPLAAMSVLDGIDEATGPGPAGS